MENHMEKRMEIVIKHVTDNKIDSVMFVSLVL